MLVLSQPQHACIVLVYAWGGYKICMCVHRGAWAKIHPESRDSDYTSQAYDMLIPPYDNIHQRW